MFFFVVVVVVFFFYKKCYKRMLRFWKLRGLYISKENDYDMEIFDSLLIRGYYLRKEFAPEGS